MSYAANIWKFYVYKFLTSFFLLGPIIILFYLEHIPYSRLGIVLAIGFGVASILELPSGVWADLIGHKKIVAIGVFLSAIEVFLIAYGASFYWFILAAIIGGVGSACTSGADTALLFESLKKSRQVQRGKSVIGRVRAIRYVSILIAALIGAPLYAKFGALPLYLNAGILAIASPWILTMKEPTHKKSKLTVRSQLAHMKASLRSIIRSPTLLWYVNFAVFSGAGIWVFHDLLRSQYYVEVGYVVASLGVITAGISFMRSFFSWFAHRTEDILGARLSIVAILVLPPVFLALMGWFSTKIALLFVFLLYAVASIQEVFAEFYLHTHTSSKQRATVFSIHSLFNALVVMIGMSIVGYISEVFSMSIGLYVLAGASVVSALMLILWYRS